MAAAKQSGKGGAPKGDGLLVVSQNRRAFHDDEIGRKVEAGIVLTGGEVKSIRSGTMNLRDSYVRIRGGEAFLLSCHIQPYRFAAVTEEKESRERKLLLNRKEIEVLDVEISHKGLSIIPTRAYFKGGRCKIELGIGRGKKHHDKRQDLKKKDADRAIARAMKQR